MKEKVIDLLNQARARELTAIGQYMAQHYQLEDRDFGGLAGKMKEVAIQEMKHAEDLAERILFLGGEPTTKPDAQIVRTQEEIADMLKTDVALEAEAAQMYNESAVVCAAERDQISKELFEKLLGEEEEHLDSFQNVLDHVNKLGADYLATLTG